MIDDDSILIRWPFEPMTVLVGLSYRIRLMVLCCLVALVAAFGISRLYGTRLYEAESMLIYVPTTSDEANSLQGPRLQSRKDMVKVPQNIEEVRRRLSLSATVAEISDSCDVAARKETQVLTIRATWSDPITAAAIANGLRDVFLEHQRGVLQEGLQRQVNELTRQMERARIALDLALDRQRKIQTQNGLRDVDQASKYLLDKLGGFEVQLEQARLDQARTTKQLKTLPTMIAGMEKQAGVEHAEQTSAENLRDGASRASRLREAIRDDRERRANTAELDHLEIEKARLAKGLENHIVSQVDYEKVHGEYERVKALIVDTDQVAAWKKQLAQLDWTLDPQPQPGASAPSMLNDVRMKSLNMKLETIYGDEKIAALATAVRGVTDRLSALPELQKKLTQLAGDVRRSELALDTLQSPLTLAKRALETPYDDFQVVTTARPPKDPFQSNRGTVLIIAAVLLCLLVSFPIVLTEIFHPRIRSGRELSHWLGGPCRSRSAVTPSANVGHDPLTQAEKSMLEVYDLARYWIGNEKGRSRRIWVGGADEMSDVRELLDEITAHMVMQRLTVSVVHLGLELPNGSVASQRGDTTSVVAYLQGRQGDLADVIPALDESCILRIGLGGLVFAPHLLTGERMAALLDELQRRSNIVLIQGPSGSLGLDAIQLAKSCDRIFVFAQADTTMRKDVVALSEALGGGVATLEGFIEGVRGRFRWLD